MKKKDYRVVVMGDQHAGHRVGLTPPSYDSKPDRKGTTDRYQNAIARWYPIRRELWNEYDLLMRKLKKTDRELILVVNGDCIDGDGYRSGGTEQLTTDMSIQSDIATSAILKWHAEKIFLTYGTSSHTGTRMDHEDQVAENVGGKIRAQHFLDFNGTILDVKHHPAGGANMPHTRKGPTIDAMQNMAWAREGMQPTSDIIVRNHLHFFKYTGDHKQLCVQNCALQGQGSKYGSVRCAGVVHWGMCWFDIDKDGSYSWDYAVKNIKSQKTEATVV